MSKRGENIHKRADGRWEGRLFVTDKAGNRKYKYVYAHSYKEVKEKMNELLANPIIQFAKPTSKTSLCIIAQKWLDIQKLQLKESSYVKYLTVLKKHILPALGDKEIEKISKDDVAQFSTSLFASGLAPKTVSSILSVLRSMFSFAREQENMNVMNIPPINIKKTRKNMRILSVQEQNNLTQYLYSNLSLSNLGILLCLYTGMRIGEICALKWEDIDLKEQIISVHSTMQRLQKAESNSKTKVCITKPKSPCSIRKIPLPDTMVTLLSENRTASNCFVLTGADFDFVEPRTLQNRFKSVLEKAGIEKANFHALRHTFATRCVELGFDVKSLSEILGHATVNITLNRYVHPSMETKQKNMNMLSDFLVVK